LARRLLRPDNKVTKIALIHRKSIRAVRCCVASVDLVTTTKGRGEGMDLAKPRSARTVPLLLLGGVLLAWVLPFMSVSSFFFGSLPVRLFGGELSVFGAFNELGYGWLPWLSLLGMGVAAIASFSMDASKERALTVTLGAVVGLILPVVVVFGVIKINEESSGLAAMSPGLGLVVWVLACAAAIILIWREGR
jgi:hypothetical protein